MNAMRQLASGQRGTPQCGAHPFLPQFRKGAGCTTSYQSSRAENHRLLLLFDVVGQASDGRSGFLADGIHQDGKAVPPCPHWQQLHPRRQFRGAGPYNRQIGPILLTKRGLFLSCLEHNVWLKSPCQRHIFATFFLLECSAIKFENAQQVAKSFEHAFNLNTRCYFTFLSEPMPNAPPPTSEDRDHWSLA